MWLSIRSGAESGRVLEAAGQQFVIGREDTCDLVLADEQVSRQHAQLGVLPDGRVIVQDLGSTNGTFVNGERIDAPTLLNGGEELRIGDTVLVASLEQPVAGAPTRLAAPEVKVPPAPRAAPAPSPSRVERVLLRRATRRAQILAGAASAGTVVAVVIVVLFVAGAFGGKEPASVPELIEAAKPSVAEVIGVFGNEPKGLGTGWVLGAEEGLIVTNAHVVNEAATFAVRLGEEPTRREADVVGVAPCEDLAVLRTRDTEGFVTLPLGSQSELRQGDEVVALGYPLTLGLDDELVATQGVVSVVQTKTSLPGQAPYPNVAQTDAAINPGNSGGPLLALDRKLIGVNTFHATQLSEQYYAIGVDRVKEIVATLREGRSLGWAGMGLVFQPPAEVLAQLGFPAVPGILVINAKPGTSAAKAGLGDTLVLILAIDGKAVDGTQLGYCKAVGDLQEGDRAVFTVLPPGTDQLLDVDLAFE